MKSYFFFSSRRRHTRSLRDWSSDVCSSDLAIAAESLFGVSHLTPQLERRLEVTLGVGEPVGRLALQTRLHGGGQRTGWVVGPDPVVGEPSWRGEPVGLGEFRVLGEDAGEAGVQPCPVAGQQLAVQRLLG